MKDCFVGVSGAPERAKNHAEKIMDMAMDMRDCVQFVPDPRPGVDGHIKIRWEVMCTLISLLKGQYLYLSKHPEYSPVFLIRF